MAYHEAVIMNHFGTKDTFPLLLQYLLSCFVSLLQLQTCNSSSRALATTELGHLASLSNSYQVSVLPVSSYDHNKQSIIWSQLGYQHFGEGWFFHPNELWTCKLPTRLLKLIVNVMCNEHWSHAKMDLEKDTSEVLGKGFKNTIIIFKYMKKLLSKQIVKIVLHIYQK